MSKTEDIRETTKTMKTHAVSASAAEKDKLLEQALNDKRKLLQLLAKVKLSFDGFKRRHSHYLYDSNTGINLLPINKKLPLLKESDRR